jgi:serine/threonine protein phosphatase PrpC
MNHFSFSGIGPRTEMQDAGLFRQISSQHRSWCLVCDGIGGQPGGAEAAHICVSRYDEFLLYSRSRNITDNTIDYLKLGLLNVMDAFYNQVEKDPRFEHMGCTFALAILEEDKATFSWCGDSRIYVFRDGKILFKSQPHNIYFDEYRAGNISLMEAEKKKTNIITRCISMDAAFPILESKQMRLKMGDRILVCTDGVWNDLDRGDLMGFARVKNLQEIANQIEKKLEEIASDNYWGWVGEI